MARAERKLTDSFDGQRTRRAAKSAPLAVPAVATSPAAVSVVKGATKRTNAMASVVAAKSAAKQIKATPAVTPLLRRGSKDESVRPTPGERDLLAERDAEAARDGAVAALQRRVAELNRALEESDELRAQQVQAHVDNPISFLERKS